MPQPGGGAVLCLTWSKAINLWIKLQTAKNTFNLLRCWFSFLRSFYTVNEVHKFQYSKPVRKGEKDPDNEFAVITLFFSLSLLFPGEHLKGAVCRFGGKRDPQWLFFFFMPKQTEVTNSLFSWLNKYLKGQHNSILFDFAYISHHSSF